MSDTNTTDTLVNQAVHSADQAIQTSQRAANDALKGLANAMHDLRLKADRASDNTVSYIRHEPVKSVLIAAATGAALMALISLLAPSRSRH